MARKNISKKIRFEVFKRDGFTCQYCGNKAPDVVLEIDHIEPVSKGGTNEVINLVTSCFECNRGKSDRKLNDKTVIQKQQEELEQLNERRQQLEWMMLWRKELLLLDDEVVDAFCDYVESLFDGQITEQGKESVKKWLKSYSLDELLDAADTSFSQYNECGKAFSMVPRIAYYNKNPEKKIDSDLFYIRGILRNRLPYINEQMAIILLKKVVKYIDKEELKDMALEVNSWTQFKETIEGVIETGDEDGN